MSSIQPFQREQVTLYLQNILDGAASLPDQSFDLAIADPPYGASTQANWQLGKEHGLNGFGGAWKLASETWDLFNGIEGFEFTLQWLKELRRLVKPTGRHIKPYLLFVVRYENGTIGFGNRGALMTRFLPNSTPPTSVKYK